MAGVIEVNNVTKCYNIYASPSERLKELLSITKKTYHSEFMALDEVSLSVSKGETLGIIGRNGSGKSTLLKIICGVLTPTSGTVATTGRISALLELGTGFNPEMTGRENAYINGTVMGFSDKEMDRRIRDIEDFADIGDFIDQPVKKYSSGMYVRLAFACAIHVDPDVLVVDEALAVGDIFFQQKCYRKIAEFSGQGKTILFVTHALESIQKHCNRVIWLEKGAIKETGDPKRVIDLYMKEMTKPELPDEEDEAAEAAGSQWAGKGRDRCPEKPNYNKNELRYGNASASVVDFSFLDAAGEEALSVKSGESTVFRYEVEFDRPVENPIYGFMIKTREGIKIYGYNTMDAEVPVKPGRPGDRVTVEFRQNMDIATGSYFLTAGVAEKVGDKIVPVDRRFDLALMRVIPADKSFGMANLFSGIEVREGAVESEGRGDGNP